MSSVLSFIQFLSTVRAGSELEVVCNVSSQTPPCTCLPGKREQHVIQKDVLSKFKKIHDIRRDCVYSSSSLIKSTAYSLHPHSHNQKFPMADTSQDELYYSSVISMISFKICFFSLNSWTFRYESDFMNFLFHVLYLIGAHCERHYINIQI